MLLAQQVLQQHRLWGPTLGVGVIYCVGTENIAIATAQVESSSIQNDLKFL